MRILSVDPGETTGWVMLHWDGKVQLRLLDHGLSKNYRVDTELEQAFAEYPEVMIVERPPQQGNAPHLIRLYGELLMRASEHLIQLPQYQLFTPYPGAWKPWAKRVNPELPAALRKGQTVRHCRDAYHMAVWKLVSEYRYRPNLGGEQ